MTELPAYINDPDALVTAAWNGEYQVVQYLIQHGQDLESADESGNTALITTADQGYIGIVELLLKSGANVNARNTDGDSAIDIAKFREHDDIVDLLRKFGADETNEPSALEKKWNQIYAAFQQADVVKRLLSNRKRD